MISRAVALAAVLLVAPAVLVAQAALSLDGEWKFRAGDSLHWAAPDADDREWTAIPVPGPWEHTVGAYDGYAWYRRTTALPDTLAGAPVGIRFGTVGDAFELYWNGVRVGGSGRLPPRYVEGVEPVLFLIPDSVLARAEGGRHTVAVRVYNDYAYGG